MIASRPGPGWATALAVRTALLLISILILSHALRGAAWAETSYGIQIASYQDLDTAVEQVNYLKRLGYNAFYRYETVEDKGKWYRVYIDRFPTKEEARREASALQKLELIKEFKIRDLGAGQSAKTDAAHSPKSTKDKPRPEAHTEPAPDTVFLLHVSSFKEKEHAADKVRMLESAGQKAFYVQEELSGGTWYRVYIGKYETEKAARAAGKSLKSTGHISYFKPLKIDRSALR